MPVSIRYATPLLLLSLVSCTATQPTPPPTPTPTAPIPTASTTPSTPPQPTPKAPSVEPTPQVSIAPTTSITTVPVKVYHMDSGCDKLVKQTEQLPKDKTLEGAIGSVLNRANTADFTITDYRVTTQDQVATIVLRLPAGGKRSFASMSSCEQMSFFGAMRETVVQRNEWGMKDVKFTDGKKEIQF